MPKSATFPRLWATALLCALLAACGGGGEPVVDDTAPVPPITEPPRAENLGLAGMYIARGDGNIDSGLLLIDASGRFMLRNVLFTPGGSDTAEDVVLGDLVLTGDLWRSTSTIFSHTASRTSGALITPAVLSAVRTTVPDPGWDVTISNAPATAIATRLLFRQARLGNATGPYRIDGSYNGGAITIEAGTGRVRGSLAISCGFEGYATVTDPNVNVARLRVFISGVGCAPSGIPGGPAEFIGYYFVPPTNVLNDTGWIFFGQVGDRPYSVQLRPVR